MNRTINPAVAALISPVTGAAFAGFGSDALVFVAVVAHTGHIGRLAGQSIERRIVRDCKRTMREPSSGMAS